MSAARHLRVAGGPLGLLLVFAPGPSLAQAPNPWGAALGFLPALEQGEDRLAGLPELHAAGARDLLLTIELDQHGRTGRLGAERSDRAALVAASRAARATGLRLAWQVVLWVDDPDPSVWRGLVEPAEPERWWSDYRARLVELAVLAEREQVAVLAIGSELTRLSAPAFADEWRRLAAALRGHYSGRLAFVLNHDALDLRAPLEAVDVTGVSAYFPLDDAIDPDPRVLRRAWSGWLRRLERLAADTGRPVVLFELGYPSLAGAARAPWDHLTGAPTDLVAQRDAWRAAVDAVLRAPWVGGVYAWVWAGPGGRFDRHYTWRGKPAAVEVERLWRSAP